MKNLFFAVAAACGCAFFAYAEQVQNWFSGGVASSVPTSVNGAWKSPSDGVTTNASSFTLELGYSDTMDFTPTANAAPDTNVMTRVTTVASFVPAVSELPTPPDGTKTALMVSNNMYYAYAWVAASDKMDWVAMTGGAPTDEAVTVLSEIDYRNSTPRARFGIITNDGATTNYLLKAVGEDDGSWLTLGGTTPTPALVGKVSFCGEGEVVSVRGDVQLGVAAAGNPQVKYGELQDAINALGSSGGTVTLLRDIADTASIPANVTIDTNGKEMAGTVEVADGATLETTTGSSACIDISKYTFKGDVNLQLKDAAADVVSGPVALATGANDAKKNCITVLGNNNLKDYSGLSVDGDKVLWCTIKTSDAQVNAITAGGKNILGSGQDNSALRTFLNNYASTVYNGAYSSSDNMSEALAGTPTSGNGLPLWESYVLDLNPNDATSKPAAVVKPATQSTSGMVLTVPTYKATLPVSNYTVKYVLEKSEDSGTTWTSDKEYTDATTITVPFNSNQYRVNTVIQ